MIKKLVPVASGFATIAVAAKFGAEWWVYIIGFALLLFGLIWLGAINSEPDRSGRQKWSDGSGGGSGE
ncbi:MAG: hypothetical protein ABJ320_18390 [Lentilitoribacter sp.]|uniref:hypothetical protein n=1 Tax=Tateyamaria sp. TaxID=1929288 RepID=UPI00328E5604